MFSFAMTSGLASDSDKFKITITLRRAHKFGDTGPYKNFDFLYNPLVPEFFAILAKIYCPTFGDARHKWVIRQKWQNYSSKIINYNYI